MLEHFLDNWHIIEMKKEIKRFIKFIIVVLIILWVVVILISFFRYPTAKNLTSDFLPSKNEEDR